MSSLVDTTMSPEDMIFTFKQKSEESFKEAWSRIYDWHGKTEPKMTLSFLLSCFYFGLALRYRYALDACRGNLETVAMGWLNKGARRCATMGPARDCANRDTSVYLGSGPSTPEVKPLLPACFVLSQQWLQCSSSYSV
jgi:hypothetical protein